MTKNHLKRLAMPKTWKVKKKGIVFVTRPNPGPHSMKTSMPLNIVIRDILNLAKNTKEVKLILQNKNIVIDGKRQKDHKLPVGLFDILGLPDIKKYYRIILNKKGKLTLVNTDKEHATLKPCKIIGKTKSKSKTQLNLFDGKNKVVEKDVYKIGDTIVITLPKYEIKEHIKLENGSFIFLIGGKHSGDTGKIEDISQNKVRYKSTSGEVFETAKKYIFVIGKDKPVIKLE